MIVSPGATVPPDAGLAVTVTVSAGCVVADELLGTNVSSHPPTATTAGTMSMAPRRAGRRALRWVEVDRAELAIQRPLSRQPEGPVGTGHLGRAGHTAQ